MNRDVLPSSAEQAAVWRGHHLSDDLERTVRADIVEGERPDHPMRRMLRRARAELLAHPLPVNALKVGVEVALAHLLPDLVEDAQTPLGRRVR